MTALRSLMVVLHVTIGMKDEVWPAEVTKDVVRHMLVAHRPLDPARR